MMRVAQGSDTAPLYIVIIALRNWRNLICDRSVKTKPEGFIRPSINPATPKSTSFHIWRESVPGERHMSAVVDTVSYFLACEPVRVRG